MLTTDAAGLWKGGRGNGKTAGATPTVPVGPSETVFTPRASPDGLYSKAAPLGCDLNQIGHPQLEAFGPDSADRRAVSCTHGLALSAVRLTLCGR